MRLVPSVVVQRSDSVLLMLVGYLRYEHYHARGEHQNSSFEASTVCLENSTAWVDHITLISNKIWAFVLRQRTNRIACCACGGPYRSGSGAAIRLLRTVESSSGTSRENAEALTSRTTSHAMDIVTQPVHVCLAESCLRSFPSLP